MGADARTPGGAALRERRARRLLLFGLAALLGGLAFPPVAAWLPPFARHAVERMEAAAYDRRLDATPTREPSDALVLVAIDDASVAALGRFPWRRSVHARLIDRLTQAGARAIVFDVSFHGPSGPTPQDAAEDAALARALRSSGRVVLARGSSDAGPDRVPPAFARAAVLADPQLPRGPGGVVRQVQLGTGELRPLSLAALELYLGQPLHAAVPALGLGPTLGDREIPATPGGDLLISFPGRPFRRVSYAQALQDDVSGFRDRIALVASTEDPHDRFSVPRAPGVLPGGEIHAAAIDTILGGHFLHRAGPLGIWTLTLLAALAAALALYLLPLWRGLAAVGLLALGWLGAAWAIFAWGRTWIDVAAPCTIMAALAVGALAFENHRVRGLFTTFLPHSVAREVLAGAGALDRASERVATVLFVDIRGYTTLSEALPPEEVRQLVNRFHRTIAEATRDHRGYVCSFQGDAEMVIFGAPDPDPDHAAAAVRAAVGMVEKVRHLDVQLQGEHPDLAARQGGSLVRVGVGICTGPVSLGFVGAEGRREYAALGDTTNTAARLQGAARDLGVSIVVSHTTAARLGDAFPLEPLPAVALKGKAEPHALFGVRS